MAVLREHVHLVVAPATPLEEVVRPMLALGGEAPVARPGQQDDAGVGPGAPAKVAGSSAKPSTATSCPARMLRDICRKKVSGTGPNSPLIHSWVVSSRRAWDHRVGLPAP